MPDKKAASAAAALAHIYPIQDEAGFEAVEKSFHRIPFGDPQLEFNILLPKDWTSEQPIQAGSAAGDLSRKLMGDLALFKSPVINTMQAVVTIQSVKLAHEISAENWLKNYILMNNYALQDKIIAIDAKRANAYGVSAAEEKSSYVYMAVRINGDNAVIIRFESPMPLKEPLAFVRKRIVDSFQFILETEHSVETQNSFNFSDVLKFNYPESWTPNHIDTKDTHNMSMQLYSKSKTGNINGLIRFVVVKRSADATLQKQIDELKKYFDGFLGIDFKKLVSSGKASVGTDRFIFSRDEEYQVASKTENSFNQDLHLIVLGDKDYYVFAFLLTPTESSGFYIWACNTRAFDMIIKSLR